MANKLLKVYSAFGGIDSRTNTLLMDPRTFRRGAKNFRYNFQDELQNSNGFQRKDQSTKGRNLFEYKYTDVNTGESKSQVLSVETDGKLYRKISDNLKWTTHTGFVSYSFYYDEVADNFKLALNPSVGSATITTVSLTTTMAQLATALNLIAGVVVTIVDDDGTAVVASTKLAYLMDCVIADTTFSLNGSWSWFEVPYLDSATTVPFPTTRDNYSSSSYKGISSQNLNNCCYITDGLFPMKYDGKAVYRAGVPKVVLNPLIPNGSPVDPNGYNENITGINIETVLSPTEHSLDPGVYYYKYRFGMIDYNGAAYYGNIVNLTDEDLGVTVPPRNAVTAGGTGADGALVVAANTTLAGPGPYNYTNITVNAGVTLNIAGFTVRYNGMLTDNGAIIGQGHTPKISNKGLKYGKDFGVAAAKVVSYNSGTKTITVVAGHNIRVGMCVRQISRVDMGGVDPQVEASSTSKITFYAKVSAVTATTIVLEQVACDSGTDIYSSFFTGQIINAFYTQENYENHLSANYYDGFQISPQPPGIFLQIFSTVKDAGQFSTYYHIYDMPVPYTDGDIATFYDDDRGGANTFVGPFDTELDESLNGDLPRACSFLSQWQNQLVQGGRPLAPELLLDTTLTTAKYPSIYNFANPTFLCQTALDNISVYTESYLCDFQSFYWNDPLAPEGFPQSGLNEQRIDTPDNDVISGFIANKDAFFVFKTRSTSLHTGTLSTGDIVSEVLEVDVGCGSHRSIQNVMGMAVWNDAEKGFYSCVAGRLPVHIGFPISDYNRVNQDALDFSQAVSANYRIESLYICAVGSTTFVYDYAETDKGYRNCWYIWDRFNTKSILATADERLLLSDTSFVHQMKRTNTKYDMTDHTTAIDFHPLTGWYNMNAPTVDKNWVKFWVNSVQGDFTLTVEQYGNYLETSLGEIAIAMPAENASLTVKQEVSANIPKLSAMSLGFRNQEKNKLVKIQGWELEYGPDFDPGEPKR